MGTYFSDLRYALRTHLRNPGFSLLAIVTLALGIGANTAVFSVINTVLVKPLPYRDADRLALIWTNFGVDLPQNWISGPEYVEMQQFNRSFEQIAIVVPFSTTITGEGEPEQVDTAAASGNFFETLQVSAALGRVFGAADDRVGADPVAILSDGFWRRRFGARPDIVGHQVEVNGIVCAIVGVLPADFKILHPDAQFARNADLWLPLLPATAPFFGGSRYEEFPRGAHGFRGIGRLKPGVTLAQGQADMNAVAASMQASSPDYYDFEGWGITVLSMHGDLVEEVRPALVILQGAVAFVLLIACVNVANLMLVRAAGRRREMAVRTSLGASRSALLRQLLTESVTLSMLGGAGGLLLAVFFLRSVAVLGTADLPRGGEISLDFGVLLFTALISIVTGVVFGLVPAPQRDSGGMAEALKEAGRGMTGGISSARLRKGLVVAELALALVLLVGAGLMIRSFARLLDSNPGYRAENLLTFRVPLPPTRYQSGDQVRAFYDELLERLRAVPGVTGVGANSQLPLSNSYSSGTTRVNESRAVPPDQWAWEVDRRSVSPGYFRTMGIQLIEGRPFTGADTADAPLVAIIDEEFARRFWPEESPIGKKVSINSNQEGRVWRDVIGVVAHSRHYNLHTVGREQVYFPYPQRPLNTMYLTLRTAVDPLTLASSVRREVRAIDPDQPIDRLATMQARVEEALTRPRLNFLLLSGFALVALALAAVGIYGLMSYSVSQRRHEIGVRMALGADGGSVLSLIMGQGLALVVVALLPGAAASLVLTRFLRSLLFEITPTDPATFVVMLAILAGVGLLACFIPSWRATRVDPARVLRTE